MKANPFITSVMCSIALAQGSTALAGQEQVSCGQTAKGEVIYCDKEALLKSLHELQRSEARKTVVEIARGTGTVVTGAGLIVGGSAFISRLWGTGLGDTWARGGAAILGVGMTAVGGIILALTPSRAEGGAMSDYYATPKALPNLIKLSDKEFLHMVNQNPEIAQNLLKAHQELKKMKIAALNARDPREANTQGGKPATEIGNEESSNFTKYALSAAAR